MNQVYLRESRILKRLAQDVFGKVLVVNAWVAEDDYGQGMEAIEKTLEDNEHFVKACSTKKKGIHYDTCDIWIQFSSGNVVGFQASEWASVVPVDIESAQTL